VVKQVQNNKTLSTIRLYDHALGVEEIALLADSLKEADHLHYLILDQVSIRPKAATSLASALHVSNLTYLDLSNNYLGDKGAALLARALKTNSSLKKLILSSNRISSTGTLPL